MAIRIFLLRMSPGCYATSSDSLLQLGCSFQGRKIWLPGKLLAEVRIIGSQSYLSISVSVPDKWLRPCKNVGWAYHCQTGCSRSWYIFLCFSGLLEFNEMQEFFTDGTAAEMSKEKEDPLCWQVGERITCWVQANNVVPFEKSLQRSQCPPAYVQPSF